MNFLIILDRKRYGEREYKVEGENMNVRTYIVPATRVLT